MTDITILSQWETEVPEYDVTDPVLGGDTGQSNQPLKKLANRTQFLYDQLWFKDVDVIDATAGGAAVVYAIDNTYSFKLIKIFSNKNLAFNLDDVSNFIKGTVLVFKCINTVVKTHTINRGGADNFSDGSVTLQKVYMCDGETLVLSADPDNNAWDVLVRPDNMYLAGEDNLVRKMPRNSAVADGASSAFLRADYARYWDAVQSIAVTEVQFASDPFRYRGFPTIGNGSTTFRFPDLRSMSFRALDLGRNVSVARLDAIVGGYEADAILEHFHNINLKTNSQDYRDEGSPPNNIGNAAAGSPIFSGGALNSISAAIGKTENRIKNIGKTPIVYY